MSCKEQPTYKNKKDLVGNWHCKAIEITTVSHDIVSFPMDRYGFATFSLDKDSLYTFSIDILHDVVLDKKIFGNTYSKTIINAGYKVYRSGSYNYNDSCIALFDMNRIIVNEESYFFEGSILYTKYIDKDKKQWEISWEKK